MFGLVLVGHHRLPTVLIEGLEHVSQKKPMHISGVCVDGHWCAPDCMTAVETAVRDVFIDDGAVILTDLLGATPDRGACRCQWPDVEIVSGMNMALVLALYSYRSQYPKMVAIQKAIQEAQANIIQRTTGRYRGAQAEPVQRYKPDVAHSASAVSATSGNIQQAPSTKAFLK